MVGKPNTPSIFLIHDSSRKDRRELFRRELHEQGIGIFNLMPAVKDQGSPIKNIARAHKNCIGKAVSLDLPRVVIMEDDVKFVCPGAYNRFLELSENLPDDWDIFTSGSYGYSLETKKGPVVKLNWFSALHCYMVNQKYYQTFLKTSENANIDRNLRGNLYMTYPMIALQYDTHSDNIGRVTSYNSSHQDKILKWNCYDQDKIQETAFGL